MAAKAKDAPPKMWKTQRLNLLVRLSERERTKLITAQRESFLTCINAIRLNMALVVYFYSCMFFKKQNN